MSKWISVDDRLPEESQDVLVFVKSESYEWLDFVYAYVCPEYGNCFFEDIDTCEDYNIGITHWMPSPKPPKG